jgi:hypothetical protein
MSSLSEIYFKLDTLKTLVKTLESKKETRINITLSINNETNDYGQNISAYVSQSKEEREAKKNRFYVANGKVFWTDGTIVTAKKKEEVHNAVPDGQVSDYQEGDLPF